MEKDKRKRQESSDLETSKHYESEEMEHSPAQLTKKQQKRLKQKTKKAKIEEEILSLNLNTTSDENKNNNKEKKQIQKQKVQSQMADFLQKKSETDSTTSIDKELKEIKEILKNVLTKDDSSLKKVIVETIQEMRDELLNSLTHRIDILEGELHDKVIENEELKKEIDSLKQNNYKTQEEHIANLKKLEQNNVKNNETLNDLEQYQRRNNLRISGLTDTPKENEEETATKLCNKLNEHMPNLELDVDDIDIAHRLGKFKAGEQRTVIVRFISRMIKNRILRNRACLNGTNVYVNEDLTKLNQDVLNSVRLKCKDDVEYAYTREGKIFMKMKDKDSVSPVLFKNYNFWLNLPWPEKGKKTAQAPRDPTKPHKV